MNLEGASSQAGLRQRAVLVIVGLIFGLAALELIVRIALPVPPLQISRGMYRSDEALAYRMRPGFDLEGEPLNSLGFRGPEWAIPRPPGRRRIAAFGDSFTFGSGMKRYSMTWPAQFQNASDGNEKDFEILDFGTPGYSTIQARKLYLAERDTLSLLDPDLILLGFYLGNDAHDNATGNLFVQVIDGNLATYRPSWIRRTLDPILGRFAIYAWGRISWRGLRAFWQRRPDRETFFAATEGDAFQMLCPELANRDPWKKGWAETEKTLSAWKRDVEFDSRTLIVVMMPDLVQLDRLRCEATAARVGVTDYDSRLPNRLLSEICSRHGIRAIDLTPEFGRHSDPASLYLPLDGHFSEAGNALAGKSLARLTQTDYAL